VGELPPAMQAALLRVLEDGSFQRVGSCEPRRARCRIIAATHRDLDQLIAEGRFRRDLYYRLKVAQRCIRRCASGRTTSPCWSSSSPS
jgi:transcriptional regulator with PAS, ATPase and Fis domain